MQLTNAAGMKVISRSGGNWSRSVLYQLGMVLADGCFQGGVNNRVTGPSDVSGPL